MAIPAVILRSTRTCHFARATTLNLSSNRCVCDYRSKHSRGSDKGSNHRNNWMPTYVFGVSGGLAALGLGTFLGKQDVLAEEKEEKNISQEVINQENRIRQYSRTTTIFDYFATYQMTKDTDKRKSKEILMSASDFYNAVTPGSSLTHGVGSGVYTVIDQNDLCSEKTYEDGKLPIDEANHSSLLNEIQKQGLLSYEDFCFLLNILSTPRRYMDIAFHCFDVSADGNVEAKEFAYVMATVTNYKGDPQDLIKQKHSGLINYLFGKDRTKEITKEKFLQFQHDLMRDIFWLEFTRYSKDGKTISDKDFCNHILLCANLTSKKKKHMIHRVKKEIKNSPGVKFEDFEKFFHVLFGGADLERAMFFLDSEKKGVNREEFTNIANWVTGSKLDGHVVEVTYALLDEDGDRNLSIKEFSPVLFQWRRSRGFQNQALHIALGQLKI